MVIYYFKYSNNEEQLHAKRLECFQVNQTASSSRDHQKEELANPNEVCPLFKNLEDFSKMKVG